MNISFERIFGTKPCNNKNYYTVLLPYKSDKIRNNNYFMFNQYSFVSLLRFQAEGVMKPNYIQTDQVTKMPTKLCN